MDKKTIGSFIAVLRKANGMTQKDFAEKLNVSDKAVSRWERDECAPDLSLLPVIAEIFGVTCDELLRGERRPASGPDGEGAPDSRKTDKQIKQLYASSLQRYQSRLLTAAGLTAGSALVMLVCSYGFYQSVLGFGLAMAFIIASLILAINSTARAVSAAGDDECGGPSVKYRRIVIGYFIAAVCANITMAICLAPLVLLHSAGYEKRVLQFTSWLPTLPFCLLVSAGICLAFYFAVRWKTARNPQYAYTDREKRNFRLQARAVAQYGVITVLLLAAFLVFISVDPVSYAARERYASLAELASALGREEGEPAMHREYPGLFGTRWYGFTVNIPTNFWDNEKELLYKRMYQYPEVAQESMTEAAAAAETAIEGIYILPDGQTEKIMMKNFTYALIHVGSGLNGSNGSYAITWDSLGRAVFACQVGAVAMLALCLAVPVAGVARYLKKRER